MADNNNNNNNGNQVVNPNNNTGRGTDNSDLKLSIANLGIDLGKNIKDSANEVIKAIKENSGNGSGNNNRRNDTDRQKTGMEKVIGRLTENINKLSAETEEATERRIKENGIIEKLNKLKDISRRGNEADRKAAKRILDARQAEISAYEERIKKEAQLTSEYETNIKKKTALESQKRFLEGKKATATDRDREAIEQRLHDITNELEQVAKQQKKNEEQRNELAEDRRSASIANEITEIEDLIDNVSSNTNELTRTANDINREVEKENRRKAKQEKVESARNYKIADNLADCFDGGLFELGDELSKTFKEATQKHLEGTRTGILGNITAFAEKTFFSIMDYQTEKLTDAISTLQGTFESTGMELSRAILADRDEIASSWQNVTDELEARGYGEALNVTDLFGLETQAAKAGITDQNLLETIALEAGITSANTGIAAPDFLADEQLIKLQQIYSDTLKEARASGLSEEAATSQAQNVVADAMETIGAQLSAAVQGSGSATAFAQGKSQELFSQYLDQYLMYDADKAKSASAGRVAVYGTVGARSGGTEIANQLNNMLLSLENENVSGELLNLLSGNAIQENLKELMDSGNYGEALKTMLSNIDTLAGDEAGVSQNVILNLLGINPEAYKKLTSNTSMQEILDSIDSIYAETSKGVQATAWTTNQEKVKSGRIGNTKEQQDRNKALTTDAVDMWSLAEKSDIRQADKMLISSINAANSGIQSVISWGFESLF